MFKNKTILITGGTGSLGKALTLDILAKYPDIKKLIIFSRDEQKQFQTLVLGPVSVLPEFQKQGIGGELIKVGHKKAIDCGFDSVILIGHPEYYPRFGYKPASGWGIKTHYQLPSDDVFMAVELKENALKNVSGMVIFPPEFG